MRQILSYAQYPNEEAEIKEVIPQGHELVSGGLI